MVWICASVLSWSDECLVCNTATRAAVAATAAQRISNNAISLIWLVLIFLMQHISHELMHLHLVRKGVGAKPTAVQGAWRFTRRR